MIVKVNYVKNFEKEKIKATIRYICHRTGRGEEKMYRDSFGWDNKRYEKIDIYKMIDEAGRNIKFFRFVLNPDPKTENAKKNLDLWKVTQDFMLKVREKRGAFQFFAVEHNDHTDKPHVHAVCLLSGRVTKEDLAAFRKMGREVALSQQEALALGKEIRQHLSFIRYADREYRQQRQHNVSNRNVIFFRQARQPTMPCPQDGTHPLVKLKGNEGKYYCPVHKRVYEQEQRLSL